MYEPRFTSDNIKALPIVALIAVILWLINELIKYEPKMYYHIKITTNSKIDRYERKGDLDKDSLYEKYIIPYQNHDPILINGRSISFNEITRITITKSSQNIEYLIGQLRNDPIYQSGYIEKEVLAIIAIDGATDVSEVMLVGPTKKSKKRKELNTSNKKVFIVHGHDENLKMRLNYFYIA